MKEITDSIKESELYDYKNLGKPKLKIPYINPKQAKNPREIKKAFNNQETTNFVKDIKNPSLGLEYIRKRYPKQYKDLKVAK